MNISKGEIIFLNVNELHPHPDNPRKDVGDISELAASIKANGVMQNLTVVPRYRDMSDDEWRALTQEYRINQTEELRCAMNKRKVCDGYTVIIGHRRLAAAKKAEIETVPCVITEMSEEEQLSTMLLENMQRVDLTVYEQAKAFQQLSLDMGMTVSEITDMSGFSDTTVRKRLKLAKIEEIDSDKFKEACDRGATLFDFAELDKLESDEAKARCLDNIGTANFKNTLACELRNEKLKKQMEKWKEQISRFATYIEQVGYVGTENKAVDMAYVRNYGSWTKDCDVEIPEDAQTTKYYYKVTEYEIDLYKERVYDSEAEERRLKAEENRAKVEATYKKLTEISARHYKLRYDFVKNYGAAKSNIGIIIREASKATLEYAGMNGAWRSVKSNKSLADLMGVAFDEKEGINLSEYRAFQGKYPEKTLLLTVYWLMDSARQQYFTQHWNSEKRASEVVYMNNNDLDNLYYFLEELGYQTSEEELKMRRGTHELFDE